MKAVTVMNDNEVLLERIKGQIRIWEAYYNETGHYREDTIFLDTGDTAVYDPYVSECMRFKVDPKILLRRRSIPSMAGEHEILSRR